MNKFSILFLLISLSNLVFGLELKQVVIFSRHNVRTPLSQELTSFTPKPWPQWANKAGELTPKGVLLEGLMGKYFSFWFKDKGLLKNTEKCPTEEKFFAYANNKQRTILSAKAFVSQAFPGCNITVHHASGNNKDSNFNPVIHNSSEIFKKKAKKSMYDKLGQVNVQKSLKILQKILDYKQSDNCRLNHFCDLGTDKTFVEDLLVNEEPEVRGPLHIGNSAVDTFKMQYYEGMSMRDVAWGEMADSELWNDLMSINAAYHDVRFNTTLVAKDIATPLILYIKDILLNKNSQKITLLMGHDANIYTILNCLKFKPFVLKEQHEKTPIGGKLVFQKYWDSENNKYLFKIEYIYQSSVQLRKAIELDLGNPPQSSLLEVKGCEINNEGFCLWDDFVKILDNF